MSKRLNKYQRWVDNMVRLEGALSVLPSGVGKLAFAGLGMGGEGGEVIDHIKKYVAHGKELPQEEFLLEMGDALFYWMEALNAANAIFHTDFDIEDIALMNVRKLQARYPDRAEF